jgi:hypothetical protein
MTETSGWEDYWSERRLWQTWLTRYWQPAPGLGRKAPLYYFAMFLFECETYTTGEIKESQADLARWMDIELRTVETLWSKVVVKSALFTVIREETSGRQRAGGGYVKPLKVLRRCPVPEPEENFGRELRVNNVERSREASRYNVERRNVEPEVNFGYEDSPDDDSTTDFSSVGSNVTGSYSTTDSNDVRAHEAGPSEDEIEHRRHLAANPKLRSTIYHDCPLCNPQNP